MMYLLNPLVMNLYNKLQHTTLEIQAWKKHRIPKISDTRHTWGLVPITGRHGFTLNR